MKSTITPFGAAIRRERQKRNLSQREVARGAKISAPYLNQMETNDFEPDPFYVVRIARFLEVDPLRMLRLALPKHFKLWSTAFRLDGKGRRIGCCQVGTCETHAPKRTGAKGAE